MRRSIVLGVLVGLGILALAGAILDRAGLAEVAMPRPGGPEPWILARASGFTAFIALSIDAVLGLLVSTRVLDRHVRRGALVELHRWVSPVAIALIAGHALLLLFDGFVRFDALDVAVPFVSSYRPVAVGLGVVAAYLVVLVHGSFALRARIGTKTWRRLHGLSFVAFVAAAAHVLLAGTDASRAWAIALVAVPVVAVIALVVRRQHSACTRAAQRSR
jgi:predicted ferric reductase